MAGRVLVKSTDCLHHQFTNQLQAIQNLLDSGQIMRVSRFLDLFFLTILSCILCSKTQASTECPFGHYMNANHQCRECLASCSECRDLVSTCQGCAETQVYNKVEQKCVPCRLGELTCGQTVTCQPNYELRSAQCQPNCLVPNCKSCQSIFSLQCLKCEQGYEWSDSRTSCMGKPRNLQVETPLANTSRRWDIVSIVNDSSVLNDSFLEEKSTANISIPDLVSNSINTVVDTLNNKNTSNSGATPNTFNPGEAASLSPQSNASSTDNGTLDNAATQNAWVEANSTQVDPTASSNSSLLDKTPLEANHSGAGSQETTNSNSVANLISNSSHASDNHENATIETRESARDAGSKQQNATANPGAGEEKGDTTGSSDSSAGHTEPAVKCQAGTYLNNSSCMKCATKCATCFKTPEQCLQCAPGWRKVGWKCIKKEGVGFNFTLEIPLVLAQSRPATPPSTPNNMTISEYCQEAKKYLLKNIAPKNYALSHSSVLTFEWLRMEGRKIILTGFLDRVDAIKLQDLLEYITQRLKTTTSLGGLTLRSYYLANTNSQPTSTVTTTSEQASTSSSHPSSEQSGATNLVAILVPSILGGVALIAIISFLVCFAKKCCCFKQGNEQGRSHKSDGRQQDPVSSHRQFRSVEDRPANPSNEALEANKYEIQSQGREEPENRRRRSSKKHDSYLGEEVVVYADEEVQHKAGTKF